MAYVVLWTTMVSVWLISLLIITSWPLVELFTSNKISVIIHGYLLIIETPASQIDLVLIKKKLKFSSCNMYGCDNGFFALNSNWGKRSFERPNWLDDCAGRLARGATRLLRKRNLSRVRKYCRICYNWNQDTQSSRCKAQIFDRDPDCIM